MLDGSCASALPRQPPCFSSQSIRSKIPQYESELITSPALIEPSATQVIGLIEFFTKRTEPSPKRR